MLKKKNTKSLHAQSVLEYVLLVGVITLALYGMMQTMKRGAQGLIKVAADEIGYQKNSDQFVVLNNGYQVADDARGYLIYSNTDAYMDSQRFVVERNAVINSIRDELQTMSTTSQTNMGFTNQETL